MNWSIFEQDCFKEEEESDNSPFELKTPISLYSPLRDSYTISIIFSFLKEINMTLLLVNKEWNSVIQTFRSTKKWIENSIVSRSINNNNFLFNLPNAFSDLQFRFIRTNKNRIFIESLFPSFEFSFSECFSKLFLENFDRKTICMGHPVKINPQFISSQSQKTSVLICVGGKFAGMICEKHKITEHRCFSRYVVRKKQGKRQVNHDQKKGGMNSVGSQMRRNNEKLFKQQMMKIMKLWKTEISSSGLVLIFAPGPYNKSLIFDVEKEKSKFGDNFKKEEEKDIMILGKKRKKKNKNKKNKKEFSKMVLEYDDPRIISIPYQIHQINFTEMKKVFDVVFQYSIKFVQKRKF